MRPLVSSLLFLSLAAAPAVIAQTDDAKTLRDIGSNLDEQGKAKSTYIPPNAVPDEAAEEGAEGGEEVANPWGETLFDFMWSIPNIYENEENPFLQQFKFNGY